MSDESDKPLQNLPIRISFLQFPATYFLTPVGRSLISQSQSIALDNLESLSTRSTDSNFTCIHAEERDYNSLPTVRGQKYLNNWSIIPDTMYFL